MHAMNAPEVSYVSLWYHTLANNFLTSDRCFVTEDPHHFIVVVNTAGHVDHQSSHPRLCNCKQVPNRLVHPKPRLYAICLWSGFWSRSVRNNHFTDMKTECFELLVGKYLREDDVESDLNVDGYKNSVSGFFGFISNMSTINLSHVKHFFKDGSKRGNRIEACLSASILFAKLPSLLRGLVHNYFNLPWCRVLLVKHRKNRRSVHTRKCSVYAINNRCTCILQLAPHIV